MSAPFIPVDAKLLAIQCRAYVSQERQARPRKYVARKVSPSKWALIFDTETTIDASQKLRFGVYQLRRASELVEAGLFYAPDLPQKERERIEAYARRNGLACLSVDAFIDDVFYAMAFAIGATIVGFNLPFDLSRLAKRHGLARGNMRGGFSFQLSADPYKPHVQIKHLSSRSALIQFAGTRKRTDSRGQRRRGIQPNVRRGFFVDVKTLAAALLSRSFSLGSLAHHFQLPLQKAETDEHGSAITTRYLEYAWRDVQVTWEAYDALLRKCREHRLSHTRPHELFSEASLGKAYLKEMGIAPWRVVQPDCPPELIGKILSTYYGGRTEVRIRREVRQVLYCDFLSMYPTVCTLMGLWRFVTARGMTWRDTTDETAAWLEQVTAADLQKPEAWRALATIVEVEPDGDIVPVRACYHGEASATIGLNHLSAEKPLWFTLADCIASKILTGRAPRILRAISFTPAEPQQNLKSISIGGEHGPKIDPLKDDAYCALIDHRARIKAKAKSALGDKRSRLEAEQHAIKILVNSTSYGIFIEMNVEESTKAEKRFCYAGSHPPFEISTTKLEKPGTYFHPLLATLITGAARLMLALTERAIDDAGLEWVFCDTDSMAIAKPTGMTNDDFFQRARSVCDWFEPLNPYAQKGGLLKIEDANYASGDTSKFAALYCLAISSKRYALFNLDEHDEPLIRKASAHGLGHLLDPYRAKRSKLANEDMSEDIGVAPWQRDLWLEVIRAALNGDPNCVVLDHLQLSGPAASRYAATTPELLSWFKHWNEGRPYAEQVRPFNFLLSFQAQRDLATPVNGSIKPIASFDRNPAKAARACFDRETGEPVHPAHLQSYADALRHYHLSPEPKFENGGAFDRGTTCRRKVRVIDVEFIGKEANKWEEKAALGLSDMTVTYGAPASADDTAGLMKILNLSDRNLARLAGLSRATIAKSKAGGHSELASRSRAQIRQALICHDEERRETNLLLSKAISEAERIGLSELARRLGCDASNLSKALKGQRRLGVRLRASFDKYFQSNRP